MKDGHEQIGIFVMVIMLSSTMIPFLVDTNIAQSAAAASAKTATKATTCAQQCKGQSSCIVTCCTKKGQGVTYYKSSPKQFVGCSTGPARTKTAISEPWGTGSRSGSGGGNWTQGFFDGGSSSGASTGRTGGSCPPGTQQLFFSGECIRPSMAPINISF